MTGVPPIAAELLHAREAIDDVVNHAVSKNIPAPRHRSNLKTKVPRRAPRISANSREALRRMIQTQASFSPFSICVVFDLRRLGSFREWH